MDQKSSCEYCGNNPVPHFFTWYQESLNIVFTPLRRMLFFNLAAQRLGSFLESLNWAWHITQWCHSLGIIQFQGDKALCKVRRAQVLWEEAEKRGYEFKELLFFGKPFDTYMAEKKSSPSSIGGRVPYSRLVFSGLPRPTTSNPETVDTMDDKMIFKQKLSAAGIPVSRGICTRHIHEALQTFELLQKPVIVKPRAGSRGRHSTTHIYTPEDLRRAFYIAKQLCSWVVIEEHIPGPVYRATVIGGTLGGVLRGDSPTILGDGIHTITQLVEIKNSLSHEGVKDIQLDHHARTFLARQGLEFNSVPEKGRQITLTEKIGVSYGGSSSEDIDICHPETKELFMKAARVLNDPIIGFDFIIPDIAKSYKEQRCAFIEANSLPFINLHHDPLHGRPQNVAAMVWDLVGW